MLQAREAVRQVDESVDQGRAIRIFTLVTLIFVRLSWCPHLLSRGPACATNHYNSCLYRSSQHYIVSGSTPWMSVRTSDTFFPPLSIVGFFATPSDNVGNGCLRLIPTQRQSP